jgi:hypothetical protein
MLLTASQVLRQLVALALAVVVSVVAASGAAGTRFPIDLAPVHEDEAARQGDRGADGLAAAAVEQLQLGCDPRAAAGKGDNPFADTVLGRLGVTFAIGEDLHRQVIAATLSQDFAFAYEHTAMLRRNENPDLRYLGWLIPAYVLAKAQPDGYVPELRRLLLRLQETAAAVSFSPADMDYLAAVVAYAGGRMGEARERIDAALAHEPRFYNAIVFGLRLRLLALPGELTHRQRCEAAFSALFDDLLALVGLTRCPLQASQSEVYLHRFLGDPGRNPAFLAAQVYLGIIARRPDHARLALSRFDGLAAFSCQTAVSRQLHALFDEGAAALARERRP